MPPRPGLARAVEEAARRAMATSTTPGLAVALVHHGQVAWGPATLDYGRQALLETLDHLAAAGIAAVGAASFGIGES